MNEKKQNESITTEDEVTNLDELVETLNEDELRHLAWGGKSGPRTVGGNHGRKV